MRGVTGLFILVMLVPPIFTPIIQASPRQSEGYLILTRELFLPELENFVRWKRELGYRVMVLTVENIENQYPGRDLPERIRNGIRDYYENQNVRWVLLVGDTDTADAPPPGGFPNYVLDKEWEIPVRYVWNPDNAGEGIPGISDDWTPTDLYYAGLDGDWDNFGENRFNHPDWIAEVYVGRWPVRKVEELRAVMEKTMKYHTFSNSHLNNFILVGARLSTNAFGIDDEGVVLAMESVRRLAMREGLRVYPFYDLSSTCYSVSLSRHGDVVAAGMGQAGKFYLFENSDNQPRLVFSAENEVVAVAIAKDAKVSVAGTDTGEIFCFLGFDNSPRWTKRTNLQVRTIRISADGKTIAVLFSGKIVLFDDLGRILWSYENENLSMLDLSENGEFVLAGTGGWVGIWHRSENSPRWVYRENGISCASLSWTGKVVVGKKDALLAFNLDDNQVLWTYRSNVGILSSKAAGGYVVAASGEPENLLLYFRESENVPCWVRRFESPPSALAISRDGKTVAISVLLMSQTRRLARTFVLDSENNLLASKEVERVHGAATAGRIYDLALSENGDILVAGGFENLFLLRRDNTEVWSFDPRVFPKISFGEVLDAVNKLFPLYINSYSHGGAAALYYWDWWLRRYMDLSTESQLTSGNCFLQVSFACSSAALDAPADCLAENLLKAPGRGAVVYIGASRAVWITSDAGPVRELNLEFWENFLRDPLYPYLPGRAFYGMIASLPRYGYDLSREEWKKNLLCLFLLGDPALRLSPDKVPPLILSLNLTAGHHRVVFSWRTSEPATGMVEVGGKSYHTSLSTDHTVEIAGLLSNTTYRYTIRTFDRAGNSSFYSGFFTTLNYPPSASFILSPHRPRENEEVLFMSTSTDTDGRIVKWFWEFGDGTFSWEKNPKHAYAVEGIYTVSLTVWDDAGGSSRVSRRIEVLPLNFPPQATFHFFPPDPNIRDEIVFDAGESIDPDGYLVLFHWRLGDGTEFEGPKLVYNYSSPGSYLVELTVRDNGGKIATYRKRITVGLPPRAPSSNELENLPVENITRILLRSEPSSAADTLSMLPAKKRVEIVKLGMEKQEKMLEIIENMDPSSLGEILPMIPELLPIILKRNPYFCARVLLTGPLQLLENLDDNEVLEVLRWMGPEFHRALPIFKLSRLSRLVGEMTVRGNFSMIDRIFAILQEKEARELWNSLEPKMRERILPHLSVEAREKLERRFHWTLLFVVALGLGFSVWYIQWIRRRSGGRTERCSSQEKL